ncbi:MAG: ABC transporter permease [Planctomycetota bacterium]|jgi:ABC-type transport system involved in multi-copper enzyme maturation permease subunit
MIWKIATKEILQNLLSYKFSIIVILSTILILVSIFVMYGDYCLAMDNHDILRKESGGQVGVIPPTPLGIFAKGLDENLCRSWELEAVGVKISSEQQKSLNNLFKLFTAPDLLYVIKVILSLCAMLFAFDMICGEKEAGTLRQSLSNRLKRPILIIGKWIGGFTSFILPFFIAVLLGTIFVTLSPMVDMNAQDWAKLGLFLLSSVIYLAAFFSLGLLVSCLTHRSSTSLVISLFVWTILVFLIPNLGNILARQFVQIPTAQQLELKREQIMNRARFERKRIPKNRPDFQKRENALLLRTIAEGDKLDEDYRNRINRLVTVSQNITGFSPAPAFTLLATDIMGTGVAEERRLKKAAQGYKDLLIQLYTDENKDEESEPPDFHYQRSSVKEILDKGGLGNCLILILLNILFFTGTYVAFLKYDVR